jgi:SAM-dependent methyltransferase
LSESTGEPEVHQWGTAPDFQGPRHELREALLLEEFLAVAPGRQVLDVGAGSGTFSNELARRGFDVTSTDVTDEAIEVLRARVSGSVERADATSLPFASASFDAVVLGEVLEHLEDDAAAAAEAARVLRPDGILAVSVPRNPAWFSQSDQWAGHVRRYTQNQLVNRIEEAGFTSIICKPWGFPVSAAYHRTVFEWVVKRRKERSAHARVGLPLLALLLRIDRRFVGHERGAIGYLLVARRRADPDARSLNPTKTL